jgi:thiamine biosynthesis lipoprotein
MATRREALLATSGALLFVPEAHALQAERAVLFGSPVTLLVPAGTPAAPRARTMAALAAMNRQWNAWKPGEVGALNRALRHGQPVSVSPALLALLRGAAALEQASGGHFNAGIGGLVGAWGFHADRLQPGPAPRAAQLARWQQARPSLAQLEVRGRVVRSANPALQLDFGGYAKGVAIDRVLARLRSDGVRDALLDLGGNLAAMGAPGRPWQVGLRDPFGPGLIARLQTCGQEAVVTSGTYERWRALDAGGRATHVIDPVSGRPAQDLVSVTVVHPSAGVADAAATALLVAGPRRWRAVAQRMGLAQVLVVDADGRQEVTPDLGARLLAV